MEEPDELDLAQPHIRPKTAFSRFPPVHTRDLEGRLQRFSRAPRTPGISVRAPTPFLAETP